MSAILLRNLDDDLVAELKRRAATSHQSVQQILREVLRQALRPEPQAARPWITVHSGNFQDLRREDIYLDDDRG